MNENALHQWIREQSGPLSTGRERFSSVHIDGVGLTAPEEAAAGIDALVSLLPSAQQVAGTVGTLTLAVPQGLVEDLVLDLPDLADVSLDDEPPSFYLLTPRQFMVPPNRDEYRCAYSATPWDAGFTAEYVCGRSLDDRARGWEFSRTIWVRYGSYAWVPGLAT